MVECEELSTSGFSSWSSFWFVIFINDLMLNIINKLELSADDTKMMSKILNANSNTCLQNDLNKLLKWSNEWSIKFNKISVRNIGKPNPQKKIIK